MEKTWSSFRFDDSAGGLAQTALNFCVGLLVSAAIFFALSRVRLVTIEKPAPTPPILQAASLPDLPPPPPQVENPTPATIGSALFFPTMLKGSSVLEPSPSESVIRVRAMSPSMGPIIRPEIEPTLNFDPGLFRPRSELVESDPSHIFNASEVDQAATPVFQPSPDISRELFDAVKDPRLTLLMLITISGTVEKVWVMRSSGNEQFDAKMVEGVKEWEFRPARRRGKVVRQWVQQPVVIRLPAGSRFAN
ncbi:MAG TPA: energy transducer TonB [Opitutaceae bacterium]|nr:energy transducer TonB [Opitutaceae bacterium]